MAQMIAGGPFQPRAWSHFAMTLRRNLAILCFFLTAATSQAWSQQVSLVTGQALSVYGLTFTVTGCSIGLNGASTSSCVAGNNLVLQAVNEGTHNIAF